MSLPHTPFQLHGGCFCAAIEYTISIPDLSSRPIMHSIPKNPLGPRHETNGLLPIIFIDHCNSCRRIPGSVMQTWLLCLQPWVQFKLESRSGDIDPVKPATMDIVIPDKEIEESTFVKGFQSSEFSSRTFCARCGTHLTFFYSGPEQSLAEKGNWGPYLNISLGSLDEASAEIEGVRPDRQVWTGDGIEWVRQMVLDGESCFGAPKAQGLDNVRC